MKITDDIIYIGVDDNEVDLFEGQYIVPAGMCYNSYVIKDEKTAVMDTVDENFGDEWLEKLRAALGSDEPDYLIVDHMESDHSANVGRFMKEYPKATVVATAKAFTMMKQFFGTDYSERRIVVSDGDSLSLGRHELHFVTAPMVHWPEVMVTYDSFDKVLFSADAFGKFGTYNAEDNWVDEARRYYIGIVGKYGVQVSALLKKAAALDIKKICPLHGTRLGNDLGKYISLYDKWARYEAEEDGVVIAYASVYKNTEKAAKLLYEKLLKNGVKAEIYDLARCDMAKATAAAFRYSKLVLASITYNGDVFPFMRFFIDHLTERGYKNRTVAFIENGSWAPVAAKVMAKMLEGQKDITYAENTVTVRSALNEESEKMIDALAEELK